MDGEDPMEDDQSLPIVMKKSMSNGSVENEMMENTLTVEELLKLKVEELKDGLGLCGLTVRGRKKSCRRDCKWQLFMELHSLAVWLQNVWKIWLATNLVWVYTCR